MTTTLSPPPPTTSTRRRFRLLIAMAVGVVGLVGLLGTTIPAQALQAAVTGTADFRAAPQLPPGTYRDRIVTGDSAWYSLVYSNSTPYEFSVSFDGVNPSDATVTATFVAPTLTVVDGPAPIVSGPGVAYPVGLTNVWFLEVSVETTGQLGVEYPILIEVSGVESVGLEACGDVAGCTLDQEFAALNVAIAEAEAELEIVREEITEEAARSEIQNLQGFIEASERRRPIAIAELTATEQRFAEACGSAGPNCEEFPDPPAETPVLGWAVGGLAFIGGAYRLAKRLGGDSDEDEDPPPAKPRTPASLSR